MFSAPRIVCIGLVFAFILGTVSLGLPSILQPMTDLAAPAVLMHSPAPAVATTLEAGPEAEVTSVAADTARSAPPEECDGDELAIFPTVAVVIAARPIEAGTSIWSKDLALREVLADASSAMALTDVELARGEVAAIDIVEKQIITPNMLESNQGTALAAYSVASPDAAPCVASGVFPTREVVVASGGIPGGSTIALHMLMTRELIMATTTEVVLASLDDAVGRVAAIDILPDQPISPNMLITIDAGGHSPP